MHKTNRIAGGAGLLLITTLAICAQRVSTQTMLGRLGDAKLRVVMEEYNRALGVECAHCHAPDQWADESKPQFATARNMNRMVGELNDRLLLDIGTVSCWTCHRGQVRPSRLPRESLDAELTRWPADLSNTPENTKLTMAVYAVSLGVGCDHCHNAADWKDATKRPMQLVSRMNAMFAEFPKFMPPTARTQCFMCHKGSTKPPAAGSRRKNSPTSPGLRRGKLRRNPVVSSFFQDVRFAWRLARRQPLPSLTTLLTLAIGLGGTTALFSVANAWLLTPLPFHEPHRLVMAWETIPSAGIDQNTPAPAILKMWRERSQAFEGFAPWTVTTLKLTGGAEPLQVDGARVSKDMLPLLGIGPLLGRNFTADEDRAGGVSAALLSEPFWTRTFGRDESIVGRTIQLDGRPVAVIGVLPSSVRLIGLDADLWLPLALTAQEEESFNRILWVMGRLRPGVSAGQGLRDLDALMREQSQGSLGANVIGLREQTVGTLERDVRLLLIATFCVLLIACANVASLTVARITGRRSELIVRSALGASRLRLARQALVEIVALGVVGGMAGVLFAGWLVRAVVALVREAEQLNEVRVANAPVLGFAFVAAIVAAALCAVVPAWQSGGIDLATSLREQTRSTTGTRRWMLNGFVIVEVGVALALLISAGLVLRSFQNIGQVNLGFRPDNLVAFQIPRQGNETPAAGLAFYDQLLRELEQVPGIQSAGLTQALPIRSSAMGAGFPIEGRRGDGSSILAYWRIVSASYFATMEMPMVSGRPFTAADRSGAPDVAIVSESFARRAWPDGSALGKRIGWGTLDRPMTVIGVVGDVRVTPASAPGPHVYMPFMQITGRLPGDLVVRADASIASVVDAVRRTVWAIDRTQPVAGVMTMDQLLWNATGRRRFQLTLVSLFAGVAALLALIGIYSVLSYAVGQSLREIGIRLALGASPSRVRWLVLREGLIVLALGSGAGLLLALWSGQLVRAFLFNLEPVDPMTYIVVVSGLMLSGFAACALPAVRASRVDPIVTLRAE